MMTADPSHGQPGIAVLIPALDEEESLPGLLEAIPRGLGPVVVVDNGSRDRTAEVARAGGATVVSEPERGYGAACLAGIRTLAELETVPEVVVFLDADHSDDPANVPLLVTDILEGRADLVLGVRSGSGPGTVPLHARMGNRTVLLVARALFGRAFQDLPPFRAIRFDALLAIGMDDRTWGWTLQMQLRAVRAGLRIHEIRLPYRPRARGRSKVSGSLVGSVRAGLKMFYTLAHERIRPAPPPWGGTTQPGSRSR